MSGFPPCLIRALLAQPDSGVVAGQGYQGRIDTRGREGTLASLNNTLLDDLADIQKGDFRRQLGKVLSYRAGTQFDESGLHLVKGEPDTRSGAVYWFVAFPEPEATGL
ncbi:hypothetical protein [Ktedonospora formicarum]|uniref:Uncharacterized protein n=1 Tax=Ktedonospora formicarum TaxID=2778364 RepID=A0A8J3I7R0_9CHLR|nr:hypothetical protein [Ktedonospora formicarum]GHO47602.1 hypothetical protein KSX_57650 [Ktedonospora formicarum]